MKSILIKLFIGAALVWSGDKLMVKERQFTTAEEVKKYKELCNALTPTTAILDDSYTQTTMKVMKVPVKMYNYTYTYKVNEQEYKGSYTVNTELNSQILMIWYDKSNPSGSQASDPCVTYQTEKAKEASSLGAWYGNIGMGLIIIGLLMAYANIKNFFGHLFGSKKSLASS